MRRTLAMMALLVVAVAACRGGSEGGDDVAVDEPAIALTACNHLRSWSDEVVELLNSKSHAMTDSDDPAERTRIVIEGIDDLGALTDQLVDRTDDLVFADVPDAQRLHAAMRDGATLARGVVDDARERFATLDEIGDDDTGVRIIQLFGVGEEIFAFTEPVIAGYENGTLTGAIRAEPACDNLLIVV